MTLKGEDKYVNSPFDNKSEGKKGLLCFKIALTLPIENGHFFFVSNHLNWRRMSAWHMFSQHLTLT